MQLITILLYAVALLAILAGFSVMAGSSRDERKPAIWFFLATLGSATWAVCIGLFLNLAEEKAALAPAIITGLYSGAILMDVGFMFYAGYRYKFSKIFSFLTLAGGIFLVSSLVANPGLLYSDITISEAGNALHINLSSWYYYTYSAFFIVLTMVMLGTLLYKIGRAAGRRERLGFTLLLVGLSITGVLALIFDILLPVIRYDLIWIGPLAVCTTILSFYYAILKYRILVVTASWMRFLSYVILLLLSGVTYVLLFFLVFAILFRVAKPTPEIFLFNTVIVVLLLLLLPVIREIATMMRLLIYTDRIEIDYIVKQLNHLNPRGLDKAELAGFLADAAHLSYVGFLVDGKPQGSSGLAISQDELEKVSKLEARGKTIWQEPNERVVELLDNLNINLVAELRNSENEKFGQVLIGKPVGRMKLDRRNVIQLEMMINLAALSMSPRKRKKK